MSWFNSVVIGNVVLIVGAIIAITTLVTKLFETRIAFLGYKKAASEMQKDSARTETAPEPTSINSSAKQQPRFFVSVVEPLLGFSAVITGMVGMSILMSDKFTNDSLTLGNATLLALITSLFLFGMLLLIRRNRS